MISIVAVSRRLLDDPNLAVLESSLEAAHPEQTVLRALAHLHYQRGDAGRAAEYQARSLTAPDYISEHILYRLALDLDRLRAH
ncbi:MAG: hypothetical protein JNM17_26520 [Archangium sp.]|nr:hypothetical protein [Archangium sp.]